MKLISYAQNCEDVLLWRALQAVPAGFYIDVGANDPVEHSVTKAFYDAGWRGINIEPMPSYHQVFQQQRPRDINLAVACGAADGQITLYDTPAVNGWASTDAATAAAHRADGVAVQEVQVPLRTLSGICAEYVDGPVHFLKIDVEGFEGEVLKGMDLRRWRPWVLVIEATLPNSRATNHAQWEHLVLGCDYQFAYFDGLNRYYVAAEQQALLPLLAVQANVFDDFMSYHLQAAWHNVAQQQQALQQAHQAHQDAQQAHQALLLELQDACATGERVHQAYLRCAATLEQSRQQVEEQDRQLLGLHQYVANLQAALDQQGHWAAGIEQQLLAITGSRSWRWLKPLRLAVDGQLAPVARRRLVALRRRGFNWLASRQALRRLLLPLIGRSPWLRRRVSSLLSQVRAAPAAADPDLPALAPAIAALPPSARQVLADLRHDAATPDQ